MSSLQRPGDPAGTSPTVLGALPTPDAQAVLEPGVPVDVRLTLGVLQRRHADPTVQSRPDGVWLCHRQPDPDDPTAPALPVTVLVRPAPSPLVPGPMHVMAWGPGADAAIRSAPALLGLPDDGWPVFDDLLTSQRHGSAGWSRALPSSVVRVRRTHPGLRLPATGRLVDQLFTVVLEQKVTHDQARAGWRWLVRTFGEPAPDPAPAGMLMAPRAETVRLIPSWQWHAGWVQPGQSRAMVQVAARAQTLDRHGRTAGSHRVDAAAELGRVLQAVPGIGAWTVAEALQRTHGSADLVAVGDYHLAHHVGEALTGRRTDDAGMLALLRPWVGHRQRVVRLIGLSGFRPARFGPRLTPADHRGR